MYCPQIIINDNNNNILKVDLPDDDFILLILVFLDILLGSAYKENLIIIFQAAVNQRRHLKSSFVLFLLSIPKNVNKISNTPKSYYVNVSNTH